MPSPAAGEGVPEAAMLDTVEGLGSWRTNGKYRIGVARRLTGVSAESIRLWLKGYPADVSELKACWKEGMGSKFTHLTKLSFLELVEILIAGCIRSGQYRDYRQVREFHNSLSADWGTQFPFAHEKLLVREGELSEKAVSAISQLEYEDGFASRWCPLGKEGALALDPRRAGGQPAFKGRRLRVVDVRDYFMAGETVESLSQDFDLTQAEVEAALRYAFKFSL